MTPAHGAVDPKVFEAWFARSRDSLLSDLCDLVALPTVSPDEALCHDWLIRRVERSGGRAVVEEAPASVSEHPHYTHTPFVAASGLRPNVRAHLTPGSGGPRILFNAHVDVVPGAPDLFSPRVTEHAVFGRGTADTKGNVLMLLAALDFLADSGIPPAYDVYADFVAEEEFGGNGTLCTVVDGAVADRVVVLEPTGLAVHRGHRGCLAFHVTVAGRAAHMGEPGAGRNAVDGAVAVIEALRALESRLLERARGHVDFAAWERPVHVNVGSIHGGQWHGSTAESCVVGGNLGFLPEDGVAGAKELLSEALRGLDGGWAEHVTVEYDGIHNEGCLVAAGSPVEVALRDARVRQGVADRAADAWHVSCDARFYPLVAGVPAVVFGAGRLEHAHSDAEHVVVDDLRLGAAILADMLSVHERAA